MAKHLISSPVRSYPHKKFGERISLFLPPPGAENPSYVTASRLIPSSLRNATVRVPHQHTAICSREKYRPSLTMFCKLLQPEAIFSLKMDKKRLATGLYLGP